MRNIIICNFCNFNFLLLLLLFGIFFQLNFNYCLASALDDLNRWSGGYTPSVPDVPTPKIDKDYSSYDSYNSSNNQSYMYNYSDFNPQPQSQSVKKKGGKGKEPAKSRKQNQPQKSKKSQDTKTLINNQNISQITSTPNLSINNQSTSISSNNRGVNIYRIASRFDKKVTPGKERDKFAEVKFLLNSLKKNLLFTPFEMNFLSDLYSLAFELWKNIIQDPTISKVERLKYQIPLVLEGYKSDLVSYIDNNFHKLIKDAPLYNNKVIMPFESNYTDLVVNAVEQMGAEASENIPPHKYDYIIGSPGKHYENILGLTKITSRIIDSDYPAAIGEGIDFLIGKVTYTPAQFAATAGKIYAYFSFNVFDKFARDASNAASMLANGKSSSFDSQQFWQEFSKELNLFQKGVFEWLGGAENVNK